MGLGRTRGERIAGWLGAALVLWMLAAVGLAAWDFQDRWVQPGKPLRTFYRLWLFWVLPAAPLPLAALLAIAIDPARRWNRWVALAALVPVALAAWARIVEPELLRVRETRLTGIPAGAQPVRIALVADLHLGLFGREHHLRRLVGRLNELQPDAVLIAGDFTDEPPRDLVRAFAPLSELRMPVFAVRGNHDMEMPGPPLGRALWDALERNRVQMIEGRSVRWKDWELVGLGDLWGDVPQVQIRRLLQPPHGPRLVLAHQPDTAHWLPTGSAFLLMAGHTHGGQVKLPVATEILLRNSTIFPWWDGLYRTPTVPVFVTPGTGMVWLPLRLGVPPTIDLLVLER
ncbi:MAG TPA: metallophosphoesterase [Ramlibacter sp.]|nr:metallophosphoesterase [Ramlibacter sp.]